MRLAHAVPLPREARDVAMAIVGKDAIWIGEPSISELVRIAGRDWVAVEAELRRLKTSLAFGDREDIEIAGEDDAIYGDVVTAIEIATAVGFDDWRITPPNGLALVP